MFAWSVAYRFIGLITLLVCFRVLPAAAQFSETAPVQAYVPGEQVNLYALWEGVFARESFFLDLPDGWDLEMAVAVRHGYQHVPFGISRAGLSRYRVVSSRILRGDYDLILRVRTSEVPTHQAQWSIAPAVYVAGGSGGEYVSEEGFRLTRPLKAASSDESQHVLALDGDQRPLLLHPSFTEKFSVSYTLEFWMRTTALNVVVVSGWDGEHDHGYELELVIDGSGDIRYYRNVTGEHISMGSDIPVADGAWHHVAITRNINTDWTRLFIDGVVMDSLFDPSVGGILGSQSLAVGSRIMSGSRQFMGELDEIRLWSTARTTEEIQRWMWQKAPEDVDQVSVASFETKDSRNQFINGTAALQRKRGGPAFAVLAQQFHGEIIEDHVRLSWESQHELTQDFLIERSQDGLVFDMIGRVSEREIDQGYVFTDENVEGKVVFYRLMQRFVNGGEQIAGTIKLGLGPQEPDVMLLGNHPNPFNQRTSISYEVREAQHIALSVLDMSGHLIQVLVERQHQPGIYEARFDGQDYPSGVYFARLKPQYGGVQSHKITLTK